MSSKRASILLKNPQTPEPEGVAGVTYEFEDFRLDPRRRVLSRSGAAVPVPSKAFDVLVLLVSASARVVEKDEFLKQVWPDTVVEESNLSQAIFTLRKALGERPNDHRFIVTLPGRGYRFVAVVSEAESARRSLPAPLPRVKLPVLAGIALAAVVGIAILFQIAAKWGPESVAPVEVTPLTSLAGRELYPSLSPDGKLVAFSWAREDRGNHQVFILPVGSHDPRRLSQGPGKELGPKWSPDGRWIAFVRAVAGAEPDLVIVPAAGGVERRVANVSAPSLDGQDYGGWLAWSPDGQWLAVSERPVGEPAGLFLVSVASGEKHRLTSGAQPSFGPAFSPDGRNLAFVRVVSAYSDVYVLPLERNYLPSSPPRQITFDRRVASSPAWSPDGKTILFVGGERWIGRRIYRIAASGADGAQARRTTLPLDLDAGSFFSASFSPSGVGRFVYEQPQFDPNIWSVEWDGVHPAAEAPRRLIASTRVDMFPQFSPDGKRIAFVSTRSGAQEIWLSNRDGSESRQLTRSEAASGDPRWSPDGRWIAFDTVTQGRGHVFVVSASSDSDKMYRIASGVLPSWSRDGQWIYFRRSQMMKVRAIPPFSSQQDPVPMDIDGTNPTESADGKDMYYFRNRSLWSVPTAGGDERLIVKGTLGPWAMVDSGLFFVSLPDANGRRVIQFYQFSTGETRSVAGLDKPVFLGLSASADGRSILYSQVDRDDTDLMLVNSIRVK